MGVYDLTEKLELTYQNFIHYGKVEGYYYSSLDTKIGAKVTVFNFTFRQSLDNQIRVKIQKAIKVITLLKSALRPNDTISIVINYLVKEGKEEYANKAVDILNTAVNTFKELNLKQYESCVLCAKETEEEVSLQIFKDYVVPMHKQCHDKYNDYLQSQKAQEDARVKFLPASIFIAIIGAIVGLIPTIITILAFELIFVWLFALIPLAAFYGYKIGKAPVRKYTPIIIAIISFVVVLVSQVLFWHLDALAKGYNGFLHSLQFEENSQIFIGNMIKSLAFTALGLLISWRVINNKKL